MDDELSEFEWTLFKTGEIMCWYVLFCIWVLA